MNHFMNDDNPEVTKSTMEHVHLVPFDHQGQMTRQGAFKVNYISDQHLYHCQLFWRHNGDWQPSNVVRIFNTKDEANAFLRSYTPRPVPEFTGLSIPRATGGGKLAVSTFKNLLKASYHPQSSVDGFNFDHSLSSDTSKVFIHPQTNQAIVAHRGTEGISDWLNNAAYAYGGTQLYKMTPRYKEAERVQKAAEDKYGAHNVTTIGHSQGGLQAELLGDRSKEIITFNKATRPLENKKNDNQYDIRSSRDVVSALNPFQKKSSRDLTINSPTGSSAIAEHNLDTLNRLDPTLEVGRGIRRLMTIKPRRVRVGRLL